MANEELLTPSEFRLVMDDLCMRSQNFPHNIIDNQLFVESVLYDSNEIYDNYSDTKPQPKRKKLKINRELNDNPPSNFEMLPCLEPYAGDLDFQLILPADNSANKWKYSKILKKVFINISKVLAIHFKWNYIMKPDIELYIRAMPVYTSHDFLNNPVVRCPIHLLPDNPLNANFPHLQHVLRCEHSSTKYVQDEITKRFSCVTPLSRPSPGSETTTLTYKFVCKTSCSRGMDRKPISVVFTLEDINGAEYGRQKLAVKICSCPKRDKVKEEKNESKQHSCSKSLDSSSNEYNELNTSSEIFPDTKHLQYLMNQNVNENVEVSHRQTGRIKKIKDNDIFVIEKFQELANTMKNDLSVVIKEQIQFHTNEVSAVKEQIQLERNEMKEFFLKREENKFGLFIEALLQEMPPQIMIELQNDILKLINERRLQIIRQNTVNNCLTPESSIASPGFAINDWQLN